MISGEGERIAHIWAWSSVDDTGARGEQEEEQGEMVEVSALGTDRGGCATADWLLIERDG